MQNPRIGPYTIQPHKKNVYCMIGDSPAIFAPKEKLNSLQLQHAEIERSQNTMWAMYFVAISKPGDEIYLHKEFLNEKQFFEWHLKTFRKLGLEITDQIHFMNHDETYKKALSRLENGSFIASHAISYEVQEAVDVSNWLEVSKKINSKIHLVSKSKEDKFNTPKSIVVKKSEIDPKILKTEFNYPHNTLYLKADGFGGGYNVIEFKKLNDVEPFIQNFSPDELFVIQEKVNLKKFSEFSADYIIYSDRVELLTFRIPLIDETKFFGTIFSPNLKMNLKQFNNLLACAESIRKSGYHAKDGLMCGVNFFQNAQEQIIVEINGRWMAGAPANYLLKRLNIEEDLAVAFSDELSREHITPYKKFVEKNLFQTGQKIKKGQFKIIPVGFTPMLIEGKMTIIVIVVGDFAGYVRAAKKAIPRGSLMEIKF
jgi:hypothetical protein